MYSIPGLQAGIQNCQRNIQVFKDAIRKEEETIQQYEFFIAQIARKEKEEKVKEKEKQSKE
jgi:hypothetical protein